MGAVGTVACIGMNWFDHPAESGMKPPGPPLVINKHNGTISGPTDDVWRPTGLEKRDRGIVIGWRADQIEYEGR